MIRYTLLSAFILVFNWAIAKDADSIKSIYKNAYFIEAGGHGIFYSLNYERFLIKKGFFFPSVRLGITPCFSRNLGYNFGKGGQVFG
ncbi:MAG: hypothetical protein ACKVQB_12430 [Bacteroidia bacterium]